MERLEILAEQRADDVLDVAAGAERAPGAGDDDRPNAWLGIELLECVTKLSVHLERQRIETLGAVQGDGSDGCALVELIAEG